MQKVQVAQRQKQLVEYARLLEVAKRRDERKHLVPKHRLYATPKEQLVRLPRVDEEGGERRVDGVKRYGGQARVVCPVAATLVKYSVAECRREKRRVDEFASALLEFRVPETSLGKGTDCLKKTKL